MKPPATPVYRCAGVLLAGCLAWTSAWAGDRHMHSNHGGPAYSHELKPQYGGMVAEVEEVVYELVLRPGGVTIYVTERDKPVSTQAASGSLTIRSATKTLEATLIPAGTNELRAAADLAGIDVKAAVAHISLAKKGLETVRFSAKRKAIAATPGG